MTTTPRHYKPRDPAQATTAANLPEIPARFREHWRDVVKARESDDDRDLVAARRVTELAIYEARRQGRLYREIRETFPGWSNTAFRNITLELLARIRAHLAGET